MEGALNGALGIVSEYEKEEIKEAKPVQVRWMPRRWVQDIHSEGVSWIWKGADAVVVWI